LGSRWQLARGLRLGGAIRSLTDLDPGGNGSLTIEDGGLVTTGEQVQVGSSGVGHLLISSGGTLMSARGPSPTGTSGVLGSVEPSWGDVEVTGPGSKWTQDGSLAVGFLGRGTLLIRDGGVMESYQGHIARRPGAVGTATVTGDLSQWNIGDSLFVAGESAASGGTGILNVADGGAVNVGNRLQVWTDGTVNLRGGRIHVGANTANIPTSPGTLYIGRNGTVALTGGTMNVGNGVIPVITPSTMRVESNGTLAGSGTVVGNVDVAGGTVDPRPDFQSSTARTLHIDGDYTQEITGTLSIELAGKLPGQYDVLDVTGRANLSGTLVLTLDQFTPAAGDEFDILTCGDRNGGFLFKFLPPLSAGLSWSLDYGPNVVTLGVVSSTPLVGDINLDGRVDRLDAALFAQHFATTSGATWSTGDFDGDGATTLGDLALLQAHFGQPSAVLSAAVPEPASAVLAGIGLTLLAVVATRTRARCGRSKRR
jgi:T5SS/PEP-CTERM-associated repeat protein